MSEAPGTRDASERQNGAHSAPESVRALAAAYQCGHCLSEPAGLAQDAGTGLWFIGIAHDDGCPVLSGAVSDVPDTFRALKETP